MIDIYIVEDNNVRKKFICQSSNGECDGGFWQKKKCGGYFFFLSCPIP